MTVMHKQHHRMSLAAGFKTIKEAKADLPSAPDSYDDESYYRVQLSRAILLPDGTWMRPVDDVTLKGHMANQFADAITAARKVAHNSGE